MKGLNIGGWLVIERWMTPSLFQGIDTATNEYQLSHTAKGRARIEKHHQTFIKESDISWIAANGVKVLRVPVGYWVFGEEAPYVGAVDKLDWLVKITEKYNLEVLICLHGAPGAQNRGDHSGSGNQQKDGAWLRNKPAMNETIATLQRIAQRYSDAKNIWGIELLNEPHSDRLGLKLAWFHRRAYRAITEVARPGTRIVFSDAFRPFVTVGTFWPWARSDFPAIMDSHLYYCFGAKAKKRSYTDQLKKVRQNTGSLRRMQWIQPTMIGEWSAVLPYWVNSEKTKRFFSVQQDAYSKTRLHCYWSYKTEGKSPWNYRWMTEQNDSAVIS